MKADHEYLEKWYFNLPQSITRTLLLTLVLMTALPLLSMNMFLASLENIAAEFDVGYDVISVALSAYLLFTALIQIILGPIADRFGRRPVLLTSVGFFFAASCGAALADSFSSFLIFRALQGAIATGLALSRAIVSDIVPPKQGASLLGYLGMAMSLAPIIGPSVGGGLAEVAGWRSNFWLLSAFGVGLWLLIWRQLPETGKKSHTTLKEFRRSYFALICMFDFWAYTLILSLGIGAFFCFITGIPIVASRQFDMNQVEIGLGIGTITCGFLFGSFLSGRFASNYDLNTMILLGRFIACFGLLSCIFAFFLGFISLESLFGGTILVGVGNGLTSPSANIAVVNVVKDLSASAAGLSGAVIVMVGAILTALTGIILEAYPNAFALVCIMGSVTFASLIIALKQAFYKKSE
ncbi:MAG: MFS transporter [Pseudomonadota bacterium]|nr:MFS transporter [Pseudomonadota bacterium]